MITEAIVLAGGLGTRLRETVPDLPKCMAPVAGRPFLSFVIDTLRMQGIQRFVFSLGYKSEIVLNFLQQQYSTLAYAAVVEEEPLGTGGGVRLGLAACSCENVLIINGDTLFKINLASLAWLHHENNALCTIALKPMHNFDRYGKVEINDRKQVIAFSEKKFYSNGLINGGIYLVNKKEFLSRNSATHFSFEKDYLEEYYRDGNFYGSVQDKYFIDIGIPEDFKKASSDLAKPLLENHLIDKTWTLFLDRDGVINEERQGEYILHWGTFIFSKGVLEIFKKLSDIFGRIIIITNQRGVGKGLMNEATLQSIHLEMQREVNIVNGRIDRIYYCTEKEDTFYFRKPNPGMAFLATQDYPDIDLRKSIMVGNKPSDMRFGRSAGMFTVFVKTTNPDEVFPHPDIDQIYSSLYEFAQTL